MHSRSCATPNARHVAAFTIHYKRLARKANINVRVSIRGLSLTKAVAEANSEFVVNPNRELPLSGLVHNGNLCLLHATRVAVCKPLNLNVGPEERDECIASLGREGGITS